MRSIEAIQAEREPANVIQRKRELLTIQQAAKYISMSKSWLYGHASNKHPRVPCIRLGTSIRFDPKDLDEFLNQQALLSRK